MAWHATLFGVFLLLVGGGLGLPFPEDLTLIGAGVLADRHIVRLRDAVAVGVLGVVAADWLIYLVGRRYGAGTLKHPRLSAFLGAERIAAVRHTVEQHGTRAVFLARFVFGFRIVTFLAAGTFGVSVTRFALAEGAASAIFAPAMVTLGFLFTDRAMRILANVGRVQHWLILGGLVSLGLYVGLRAWAGRGGLTAEALPPDTAATPPDPPARRDRPT